MTLLYVSFALTATFAIFVFGIRRRGGLPGKILQGIGVGVAAFVCASVMQLALLYIGIENQLVDVVIEEVFKITACVIVWKTIKPVGVIAVIAGCELVVGKILIYYLNGQMFVIDRIDYMSIVFIFLTTAAFLMHLSTGIIFTALGVWMGLAVAILVHFGFNVVASRIELKPELDNSAALLLFSAILVACAYFACRFRNRSEGALTA